MWDMTARGVEAAKRSPREPRNLFPVAGSVELLEPLIGGRIFQRLKLRRYSQIRPANVERSGAIARPVLDTGLN